MICSILNSLLSREDDLVDAHSFERAISPGQVGTSATLDIIISIRSYDIGKRFKDLLNFFLSLAVVFSHFVWFSYVV